MIKLLAALLILLAGFIVGRLLGLIVKRLLHELNLDAMVRKVVGYRSSFENFISGLVSYIIYSVAIIMALNHIGLTTIVLTIIISAVVIMLVISFLLAVKDFLPNALSGFSLKFKGVVKKGVVISVSGVTGVVEDVNLLSTIVKVDDDLMVIPNSVFQKQGFIIKKKLVNKK